MTTAVVVQARMGSTRLPGKVMMPLGSKTVLAHVLTRCKAIAAADIVCLATTTEARDDVVAREAEKLGVAVFRGDENDVLSRYHGAAGLLGAHEVMRVTADCPLLDPEVCSNVILRRRTMAVDYACNFMPKSFPHGLDCEAFTMDALDRAQRLSSTSYQREHVTVWLLETASVTKTNLQHEGPDASHHRWTLDTPEDYRFLSNIFSRYEAELMSFSWRDLHAQIAKQEQEHGIHGFPRQRH